MNEHNDETALFFGFFFARWVSQADFVMAAYESNLSG